MTSTVDAELRARDEKAIRSVEAAYDSAWNVGDAVSASRLFADDALVINPSGGEDIGRHTIEHSLAELFDGRARGSTHLSDILGIHFVTQDVAVVDGQVLITGFAENPEVLVHRFTDVLVRDEGGWLITQVRAYVFLAVPE